MNDEKIAVVLSREQITLLECIGNVYANGDNEIFLHDPNWYSKISSRTYQVLAADQLPQWVKDLQGKDAKDRVIDDLKNHIRVVESVLLKIAVNCMYKCAGCGEIHLSIYSTNGDCPCCGRNWDDVGWASAPIGDYLEQELKKLNQP
jgi:hypothetical protein